MAEDIPEDDGFDRAKVNVRNRKSKMLSAHEIGNQLMLKKRETTRHTFSILYRKPNGEEAKRSVTFERIKIKPPNIIHTLFPFLRPRDDNGLFKLDPIVEISESEEEILDRDDFNSLERKGTSVHQVAPERQNLSLIETKTADHPSKKRHSVDRSLQKAILAHNKAAAAHEKAAAARRAKESDGIPLGPLDIPNSPPPKKNSSLARSIVWILSIDFILYGFFEGGYYGGIGMAFFIGTIDFLIGMIWPGALLPYSWRRRRVTIFYMYIGLIWALFTVGALWESVPGAPE